MLRATALTLLIAPAAWAGEYVDVPAEGTVSEVADRLEAAAEGAGATVFARVDHADGAEAAGMDLAPAELVIFGNPRLGTPAIAADARAGLVLPLRVLVHARDGETVLSYETVESMFEDMEIPADAEFRATMAGALDRLTAAAAAP